ncbi:unnamed protein product [Rotaria sp. Silwood1]|nr:unnamed protein product [Rotaria sp. Silwood1]CAF1447271.1 unnamed protein product [Rotaria sp. Silwood1]CAF3706698.1 unnamed protein product [Rotaria sp. Silwood1]CAF4677655.1 unnamed protein product [Rotaria sp. Silwood1]
MTSEGSTDSVSSTLTTTSTTTTIVRSIVTITRPGDTIIGVYNTTAVPLLEVKMVGTGDYNVVAPAPGVGTGFYVTPAISNASITISLLFATANDSPNRDPITVTLEGSNANALDNGSSWTLIYSGSTGISHTADPGRMVYVTRQNFSNTIAYRSYRLLVTSQRAPEWGVQYSEAQIIGYI